MKGKDSLKDWRTAKSSSTIAVTFEAEPKLKYVVLELVLESMFPGVFPFTVDDLECNVWFNCVKQG